jgi:hypothetical protein
MSVDDGEQEYNRAVSRWRELSDAMTESLQILHQKLALKFDDQTLFLVIGLAETNSPWTTERSSSVASKILGEQVRGREVPELVVEVVLRNYLRPLFSKSKPATVTAAGRKAEYPENSDREHGLPDETRRTKPWKYEDFRAIPVLGWAVEQADVCASL